MAVLTLPRRWAEQPVDSSLIDWSNPITRGLVDALLPFQKRTARGVMANAGGLINEAANAGMSRKSGMNLAPDTYMSLGVGLAAPLTHMEFAERLDNSNNRSSGTFVVGTAGFGFLENTSIRACVISAGGSITVISGAAANLLGNHCVVHVVRAGSQSLYDNGRLLTTANHSGYAPAATAYHVGAPPGETNISNRKRHFLNAVWSRELSPAEIASLNENPWQIFAPMARRAISTALAAAVVVATPSGTAGAGAVGSSIVRAGATILPAGQSGKGAVGTATASAPSAARQRSLLHLNGADGSTTVVNEVTGGNALPWQFVGGGSLTTASPYLGTAMALLNRGQSLATTAAVVPQGDWTLAFRLGVAMNSDNGRAMIASQGKDGDPGSWVLQTGGSGDTDIYFYVSGGPDISNELSSGQATAINTKLKAGNCFLVIQYMSGVMSVGFAGSGDTQVTRILNGAYPGGQTPQGILRFNTHVTSGGGLEADTGTSRVDEVYFQDGGALYPTYPFAKPTTEYTLAASPVAAPGGVSGAGAVGSAIATGVAQALPTGVVGAGTVGAAAARGGVVTVPAGVAGAGAVGGAAATGAALAQPVGMAGVAALGSAVATGGSVISGTAQPAGVSGAAALGSPTATGGTVVVGLAQPGGVAGVGSVGSAAALGAVRAMPDGVAGAAALGQVQASAGANGTAQPAGVAGAGAVGQVLPSIAAIAYAAGAQAQAFIGAAVAIGAARAMPAGVGGAGAVGIAELNHEIGDWIRYAITGESRRIAVTGESRRAAITGETRNWKLTT